MSKPAVFGRCAGGPNGKCGRLLFEVTDKGDLVSYVHPPIDVDYRRALDVGMARVADTKPPPKTRRASVTVKLVEIGATIPVGCPQHGRWELEVDSVRDAVTLATANEWKRMDLPLRPGSPIDNPL